MYVRWVFERLRLFVCFTRAKRPHTFAIGALVAATVCAVGHYMFGEWMLYPRAKLLHEQVFWGALPWVILVPLTHCAFWYLISCGRIKPSEAIFAAASILCVGDVLCYLIWLNIKSFWAHAN